MKKRIRIKAMWGIGLAALAALTLFGYGYWRSRPVPVALLAWRASGETVQSSDVNAGRMFLEEHPDTSVRLATVTDPATPQKTRAAVSAAMERGIRFFVTAHPSNSAVAILDLFAAGQALALVTGATTPALGDRDDFILRVVTDARHEQRAIARHVRSMPGRRLLVLQDTGNRAYTDPAFRFFSETLTEEKKWEIVHHPVRVSRFDPDAFRSRMAGDFDMLYILAGSYQAAIGNIAQLFHSLHPQAPIMLTPWARSRSIMEIAGPALDRLVLPSQFPARENSAPLDDYYRRYTKRFGGNMPYSTMVGIRKAFELLDQAFRTGRRTPAEVKEYLLSQRIHQTSLGPVSFNEFGDVVQPYFFIENLSREFP